MIQGKNQKQALSRDLIVDTAYRMIEDKGYRSFTMRALGNELGVSAMAFYAHFPSREEMLGTVYERLLSSMDTDPVPGERWDQTLIRTMGSIRRELRDHPEIAQVANDDQVALIGLEKHTEKIVNLHLDQGMPPEVLSQAWAIIDAFLSGFSMNENQLAKSLEEKEKHLGQGEELPRWQQIIHSAYTDDAFYDGVHIIIEGIKGIAAPDPCEWYTPKKVAPGDGITGSGCAGSG